MLDRLSPLTSNARFVVLYGSQTSDVFCTPDLRILGIEQALNEHLKGQRIDRVIFFSESQKLYFWDLQSRDRFLPTLVTRQSASPRLIKSGPLGKAALLPVQPQAELVPSVSPGSTPRMKDVQCLSFFEAAMRQTEVRSALVFSHAEELRLFDNSRELLERISRWGRLAPDNGNICVFIFHHENLEELQQYCSDHGFTYLANAIDRPNSNCLTHQIGVPKDTEIENLIHHTRFTQCKSVDWQTLHQLVAGVSDQQHGLWHWCNEMRSALTLSPQLLGEVQPIANKEQSVDELLSQLDSFTGLESVKKAIRDIVYIEIANQKLGCNSNKTRHMMFLGNPGTGKTTIARLVGQIFKAIGLLKKGHFVEANREILVGGYVGQTAIKTTKVIDSALDGVLFVDEAYALARGGDNDFGAEAIDTLVPAMENFRDRLIVIFAGYSEEMKEFVNANSGIESRIPRRYQITFPDYSPAELVEIFLGMGRKAGWLCGEGVEVALLDWFEGCDRGKNFGNGRVVRNLFEQMEDSLMIRVGRELLTGNDRITFLVEDIPDVE